MISDTIRKLDTQVSRFQKLASTLPIGTDRNGIDIGESDQLLMLHRSLPAGCSEYVLLHANSDSYASVSREAAIRYERQKRLFGDFSKKGVREIHEAVEYFDMSKHDHDEEFHVGVSSMGSGKGQVKCQKCGSKKHSSETCDTDLSKVTCFRCGLKGHVSFKAVEWKIQGW